MAFAHCYRCLCGRAAWVVICVCGLLLSSRAVPFDLLRRGPALGLCVSVSACALVCLLCRSCAGLRGLPRAAASLQIHSLAVGAALCGGERCFSVAFVTAASGRQVGAAELAAACKQAASREILLWMTPSEAPKALQASECSELLDPMRASCWISAQH